jgi:hypothetical protein
MRKMIALNLLVGATTFVGGCGSVSGGETIVKYSHNGPLIMNEVPADGRYAIYGTFDANKQVEYTVKKGERIGFVEREGQKYAVVGKNEVPIKTSMVSRTVYLNRVGE